MPSQLDTQATECRFRTQSDDRRAADGLDFMSWGPTSEGAPRSKKIRFRRTCEVFAGVYQQAWPGGREVGPVGSDWIRPRLLRRESAT